MIGAQHPNFLTDNGQLIQLNDNKTNVAIETEEDTCMVSNLKS